MLDNYHEKSLAYASLHAAMRFAVRETLISAITIAPPLKRWKFSVSDYHRMSEDGILHGDKVELFDGDVILMRQISVRHAHAVRILVNRLCRQLDDTVAIDV